MGVVSSAAVGINSAGFQFFSVFFKKLFCSGKTISPKSATATLWKLHVSVAILFRVFSGYFSLALAVNWISTRFVRRLVTSMEPMDIDQVVAFDDADVELGPVQAQPTLVIRLFSLHPLSRVALERIANGSWGTAEHPIIVLEADRGLWRFIVSDFCVRERMVRRSPWTVTEFLLRINPWSPIVDQLFHDMARVPFQAYMSAIPPHLCTLHLGRRFADHLDGGVDRREIG
ncbi:unnamed protein product [Linum trigynum]|uniref:DUF4283 domain-containing protein n=1 Tax=Linum trigynum TaxID=586398 RepID=A0AAV2F7D1_9ROSI